MVFEYSYWWIIPMVALSGAVAYLKFRKISSLPDITTGVALLVFSLRFLVTLVLLILLLNPALSFLRNVKEKPLLLLAQDNSLSLSKNKDSLYYAKEYKESLETVVARLRERFDVEFLTFGEKITRNGTVDYTENRTDLTAVFDYAENRYVARRPEGMVLLSDGIYNTGVNPRYRMASCPVYTVALGDTVRYPDVFVRNVESDRFNFINTIFPVRAEIVAQKQKGSSLKCSLRENGRTIAEQTLTVDQDDFLQEVQFDVEAKQKGVFRYTIVLEADHAERSLENNEATVYVNIIDNTGDIAVYYAAPHPDIAAIVNAVNVSGIYRCSLHSLADPVEEVKPNLIILHNPMPENPRYQQLIKMAAQRKTAVWYILTTPESIGAFARFGKDYTADLSSGLNEYATVAFNRDFPYFEFRDTEVAAFTAFPPLVVPFGELKSNGGRLLFTQKIKNTPTNNGMIGFCDNGGMRTCYLWGEGLWKWRLYSYREHGDHELFNTLVNKIVGYLAAQRGSDRFINDIRPVYEETEEVVIDVELYNDSYELVNTPDVQLELKYEDKDFSYILNRNADKYRIDLGNLAAGEYAYRLSADLKGEKFEKKGIFYVKARNVELNSSVADRQLLLDIARASGGKMYEAGELDQLTDNLIKSDRFQTVYKSEARYLQLGEWGMLGIILLILLCTEWFLLRYFAGL